MPDLLEVEFLDIIKLHHLRLTLRQCGNPADQRLAQIGLGEFFERIEFVDMKHGPSSA